MLNVSIISTNVMQNVISSPPFLTRQPPWLHLVLLFMRVFTAVTVDVVNSPGQAICYADLTLCELAHTDAPIQGQGWTDW